MWMEKVIFFLSSFYVHIHYFAHTKTAVAMSFYKALHFCSALKHPAATTVFADVCRLKMITKNVTTYSIAAVVQFKALGQQTMKKPLKTYIDNYF